MTTSAKPCGWWLIHRVKPVLIGQFLRAPINREGLSAIIGVEFDFASDKMVAGICASFSSGPSILAECDLFAPGRRQKMTIMDRSEVRR